MLEVKKRLILAQDIDFDRTGTDEMVSFEAANGTVYTGKKINAGDLPLRKETSTFLGAIDVDTALKLLAEQKGSDDPGSGTNNRLTENTIVAFDAKDNFNQIQAKIAAQPRNLNSYTLTFRFPALTKQYLSGVILWSNFYGGKIIITGGDEDNPIEIQNANATEPLFQFTSCDCEILIEFFRFVQDDNKHALRIENSRAMVVSKCIFEGTSATETFAVKSIASNVSIIDCVLTNDEGFDDDISKDVRELKAGKLSLAGGTMTGEISFATGTGGGVNISSGDNRLIFTGGSSHDTGGNLRLFGDGYSHNGSSKMAGGFALIVKKDQASVFELTGTTDGLKFDNKDITLGYPDVSAAVSLGSKTSYTATMDGWIGFYCHIKGTSWVLSVDGVNIYQAGGTEHCHDTCIFPVKKGAVVKFETDDYDEVHSTVMKFYPNR